MNLGASTDEMMSASSILIHQVDRRLCGLAITVLACALFSAVTLSPAVACDADSVLTSFEKAIQSHKTIRVNYAKGSHSLLFGRRPSEKGTLWLGPPQRYRVESGAQVFVRGFDTLWSYSQSSRQVTIRVGGLDSLEFGPAGFFGSVRTDFFPVDCRADTVDRVVCWRVRLAAKTETAAVQRLTLWIDAGKHLAVAAEYVDYNEETSHLRFSEYRSDSPKDQGRFTFTPPAGVEIVVLPARKG
jgi:outer membrane lipoprotein-sorting protein